MICKHCGNEVGSGKYCRSCGAEIEEVVVDENNHVYENGGVNTGKASAGWTWIGILVPVIGLVLYFVLRSKYPLVAKKLLPAFIIGFVLEFLLSIFYTALILPQLGDAFSLLG